MYSLTIDQTAYLELQKQQTIHTPFAEFPKRLSTLLDYCLLQLHCSCEVKSRFICVFNESENDPAKYRLYICEQNEFKHLVHLTLDFCQVDFDGQSSLHFVQAQVYEAMCQHYAKQKMLMVQKSRDNCQSMLEINENLKMLKVENDNAVQQMTNTNKEEVENLVNLHQQQLEDIAKNHQMQIDEIRENHQEEKNQLGQQLANLRQELLLQKGAHEKEEMNGQHL